MLKALNRTCKNCAGNGDPTKDTVKIDTDKLALRGKENKENTNCGKENNCCNKSVNAAREEQERRRKEAEEKRLQEEEQRKKRDEEERHRQEEAELARQRAEEEKQLALTEQCRLEEERRLEEESQRRRLVMLEEQRKDELSRQEAARKAEEQRVAGETEAVEQEELSQKLQEVLNHLGVKQVNEKKKKKSGLIFSSFGYPLHFAVESTDKDAVRVLLWGGANREETNSKKLTPLQLAQKKNKKGSHDEIISMLSS